MKKIILIVLALTTFNNALGQRDFSPKFSNKGDKIAFYSYRNGEEPEIFIMDANGKNLRQITEADGNWAIEPRWSLDDKFVGYSMGENMGKLKLAIHNLKNNKVSFVNEDKGLQFITSWTKNGIEYGSRGKKGFNFYLYSDKHKTIQQLNNQTFENYFRTTSSDANYVILSVKDEGKKGLWLSKENTDFKKITELEGKNISFSKDKKHIIFEAVVNDNTDIYMVDLATNKTTRVTNDESHDYMPSIDPSGRYIIFSSGRSGQYFLYKKDLKSGKITQLTGI
ncbi:TolB family protein [Pontimicrobium aquaticum]|uniref:WD40-like Beta Propeller Repeat n=1 Tax=Pontimicrobium aquaticum TaxID=2565367 RepID=A0A4U0ERL1_9FLAO|nr:DPP IV N-terminal domain-containing protein [Pontimicrobium aquaticum]TJY32942.1 hypothetical protein E5167_14005 [Pontimicrobium aquaticum]